MGISLIFAFFLIIILLLIVRNIISKTDTMKKFDIQEEYTKEELKSLKDIDLDIDEKD